MTKAHIKETFNAIAKKNDRLYKYKRCFQNKNNKIMFEAHHQESHVWTNYYGIKLLSYDKKKEIATWHCDEETINLINKYNLE